MNEADQKSQAIADEFARQDRKKKERSDLADTIYQIARTLPSDLGTPAVLKVLACKVLAMAYDLNITQWCKEAGISRPTWYTTHARPRFGEDCTRVAKICLGPQAIEVTQAMIRKAKYGSKDGLGDVSAQLAITRQVAVIDKPQPANAPQQVVNVTILQQEREDKLERGMGRLGWANKVVVHDQK